MDIRTVLNKYASKENIILLSAAILIPVVMRLGSSGAFDYFFASFFTGNTQFLRVFYEYLFHGFAFFLVPLLIIRFVLHEKAGNFGLRRGDQIWGFKAVFVLFLPVAGFMVLTLLTDGARLPTFHSFYPQIPGVSASPWLFLLNISVMFIYYLGFEFFYRGFMLFGLRDKFGPVAAILIQTIPSVIIHFNKPDGELFSSIAGEILFGMLALKTGSIYYGLLIHFLLGVSIELSAMLF